MIKVNFTKCLLAMFCLALAGFVSCNSSEDNKERKKSTTPTRGEIRISVDETLKPLMESELHSFHKTYKDAHVEASYLPQVDAYNEFMSDSSVVIVSTRELQPEEVAYFKQKKATARTTKIAYDAVAMIVNPGNTDSNMTRKQLESIFKGELKEWKDINPENKAGKIQVVFDNAGSSTLSYLKDYFKVDKLPDNFFAVKSNPEVIDYVRNNPNSLGVIGVGYISDQTDSVLHSFTKSIKAVGFNAPDTIRADPGYYQPYQAYINNRSYPFVREVYLISREFHNGLGTGLASFVAGNIGQPIVLSTGLVPASMPVRNVEIKKHY